MTAAPAPSHEPVLGREAAAALRLRSGGVYIDATFGRGGHARLILDGLGPDGMLLAVDRDPEAAAAAEAMAAADPRLKAVRERFSRLEPLARRHGVHGRTDGVLFDLGVSSPQLDDPARGFSFLRDGPLDMRMDPDQGPSAAQWLGAAGEKEIADVIRRFGEERHARRVARELVRQREAAAIDTTGRLAAIVREALRRAGAPQRPGRHPATRVFQAIRIHINRELEELEQGLAQALAALAAGGRLVVISFHSLEDRMTKRFMAERARGDRFPRDLPVTAAALRPALKRPHRPVRTSAAAAEANPRARSAVMRVAEKAA